MKLKREYFYWGLTAFLVICAVLVFYDTIFLNSVLFDYIGKLVNILTPVCYGIFMAYVLTPVVNWIEKLFPSDPKSKLRKLYRLLSIFITWTLVLALLYLFMLFLLPQLYNSLLNLVSNGERYYNTVVAWIQRFLEDNPTTVVWLEEILSDYYQDLASWLKNALLPQAQNALVLLTSGIIGVVNFVMNLLVGIIVSVYVLTTKEGFAATGCKITYSLLTEERADMLVRAIKEVDRIFSGFFRGKLLDSLIIGLLCFLFSSIFNFPYAPLVSVVVGVTNIIPYFGPFLGAIPSAFLILLDSPIQCLYFSIFILLLQQFDGNILGPKILGDSTGISSFWVIVAVLVGGGLGGVLGMFVGVPFFACVYSLIRWFCAKRLREKGLPIHTHNYSTHKPVTDEELDAEYEAFLARKEAARREKRRKK